MSKHQFKEDSSPKEDKQDDDICRDFLRSSCHRGSCRFKHPTPEEMSERNLAKREPLFCRDFQKGLCQRPNCRYLHCSRQDEEYYNTHGELPPELQHALEQGRVLNKPVQPADIPPCKDFIKGMCDRGKNCKFRHVTLNEYERDMERRVMTELVAQAALGMVGGGGAGGPHPQDPLYSPQLPLNIPQPLADAPPSNIDEENSVLRMRLEEKMKLLKTLETTNDMLLEENAQLRTAGGMPTVGGGQGRSQANVRY